MPGGLKLNKVDGREGSVTIQRLGALVGTMQSWTLRRRGDDGPKEALYELRAVFSYIHPHLFNDPEYADQRRILITIGRGSQYRCDVQPGASVALDGRVLLISEVKLCRPEE